MVLVPRWNYLAHRVYLPLIGVGQSIVTPARSPQFFPYLLRCQPLGKSKQVVLSLYFLATTEEDTNLPCPPNQSISKHCSPHSYSNKKRAPPTAFKLAVSSALVIPFILTKPLLWFFSYCPFVAITIILRATS